MKSSKTYKIAFFGGEPLGPVALEMLVARGLAPSLVVCNPNRPAGRGRTLTAPRTKTIARASDIPVIQPSTLDTQSLLALTESEWDLFVVVAYNHILPQWLIELPAHGTLNLHPSLLPKLRGASPIRSAILRDEPEAVGVTIILMDEQMDHGAIIAQTPVHIPRDEWPIAGTALDALLATRGADLLADTIPKWIEGKCITTEQEHKNATYTQKLTKKDGALAIDPISLPKGRDAQDILTKIRALDGWPGTHFFHNNTRIKITKAHIENDQLIIDCIIPEGKREIVFADYFKAH